MPHFKTCTSCNDFHCLYHHTEKEPRVLSCLYCMSQNNHVQVPAEDNLNLKGLALFSLHPRACIITTERVENNIHSRLCLQGTTCNYFIYAPPSQRPKNITGKLY